VFLHLAVLAISARRAVKMPHNDTFVVRDRRPGFLRVDNDLYDRFGSVLGPYGLAVYMALCRYVNQDSECWPSYATIARGTGMSRRKVVYEVAKLESLNIIGVERNQNTSNVFVLLDTSASHAPPPVHDVHPPSASHAPKQSLMNKLPKVIKNKSGSDRKNYRPEEYSDVILG